MFNEELFLSCKDMVDNMLQDGKTFKEIRNLDENPNDIESINIAFKYAMKFNNIPKGTTLVEFQNTIDLIEEEYKKSEELRAQAAIIVSENDNNDTKLSLHKNNAWPLYKKKLKEKGFSTTSIDNICTDAEKIRKCLKLKYNADMGAVKGMVVGSIQSGKTANMGALIAQCADSGWNCFIVISGMIESLRKQTEDRLMSDLHTPGNLNFENLNTIFTKNVQSNQEITNLHLDTNYRYLCVVLKQKSRLANILAWLKRGGTKSGMLKVLIIDDESDQGSVNTQPIESKKMTAIYNEITKIVNGDRKGQCSGAMNYLSYTATPYANFLNDTHKKSLYPKDLIATLSPNYLYFGPKQIFGDKDSSSGLSIVNTINEKCESQIEKIINSKSNTLPQSLIDAICWFICCVSALRKKGKTKPVSMLINISSKTADHNEIEKAVLNWLENTKEDVILDTCKKVYFEQSKQFNLKIFQTEYSNYEKINDVNELPTYEEIEDEIKSLLQNRVTRIKLDENFTKKYSKNIHLCVDNCYRNGVDEENNIQRLIYPTNLDECYPVPAFIVIGGNTLSRGLTIEGLVSTYFYRNVKQADTLMQMGRWFGYRIGYELYPRIWMNKDSIEKYEFLAELDSELRKDLKKYMDYGYSPKQVSALIKNTPKVSWLRIAAKNKSQSQIDAEFNYTGFQGQTTYFSNLNDDLNNNLEITYKFINSLGNYELSRTKTGRIWKNIKASIIIDYLNKYKFCEKNKIFNDIKFFNNWLKENKIDEYANLDSWTVILVGIKKNKDEKKWVFNSNNENGFIYKVSRSKKNNSTKEYTDIGVLRNIADNYEDITDIPNNLNKIITYNISNSSSIRPYEFKQSHEIEMKPILFIYIIDKDSKANSKGNRIDLNVEKDLVGLYITVPGDPKNRDYVNKISTRFYDED